MLAKGVLTLDELRRGIEEIGPGAYDELSYFEWWITSIAKGQWEAARSTGLSYGQTLMNVVLPQALRLTIPPLTNRTIAITKGTALGTVVAVSEILGMASSAVSNSYNPSPLTLGAGAYLILFFPMVVLGRWLETRMRWKR